MTCEDTPYEFLVDRSMECVADEAVCNCKDSNNKIICRVNGIEITYYKCKCECLCTNFQIIYPTEKELFSPYKYICNNSKVNFECNKLRRPNDDDNKGVEDLRDCILDEIRCNDKDKESTLLF
ncbi:hypothetical protein H8356DRAFT_1345620 [Neocallimastix lanati (nom. inval.)]|nr:hypothetical protein H8356DRAFT_1345620 [Neocallimastix sp. JGI-2020a]